MLGSLLATDVSDGVKPTVADGYADVVVPYALTQTILLLRPSLRQTVPMAEESLKWAVV
jgi:hypothetical protein